MRILMLQDYLRCGGTERQSVHLSGYFQAQGNDVCLLTLRPGGPLAGDVSPDVTLRSLQRVDTGCNWFAPGLFGAIRTETPDVVLCMGRVANGYAGLMRLRLPAVSVVCTARTGKKLPPSNLWSFRIADGILTNSAWWRAHLIERRIPADRIAAIPTGLAHAWDGRYREDAKAAMRQRLGVGPATVVFLNVANFRRNKRHALLIEMFAALNPDWDWQLWLVGDGSQWRRVSRAAARLIDRGRIRLLGQHPDPYCCYAAADVAVSASIEDSLPNFLVEAQTVGLPVVAMDYRGVGEGMRHGETGYLVGASDRSAFLDAVRRLYDDWELRRALGRQASAFAAEYCASDRQAAKTLDALRSFCGSVPL